MLVDLKIFSFAQMSPQFKLVLIDDGGNAYEEQKWEHQPLDLRLIFLLNAGADVIFFACSNMMTFREIITREEK